MNKYFALALLGLCAGQAQAATQRFCVGTNQELQFAINSAYGLAKATGLASSAEILVRRRAQSYVLQMPNYVDLDDDGFGALQLMGGYSSDPADDCSEANRVVGAGNTKVTDFQGGYIGLRVARNLVLEGLEFPSRGIQVIHFGNSKTHISILKSKTAGSIDFLNTDDGDAEIRIVNSAVAGTASALDSCAVSIANLAQGHVEATIANSTIGFDPNDGKGVCFSRLDSLSVQDSVVWSGGTNPGLVDTDSDQTPTFLRYNILPANNSIPGLVGQHIGGLSTDPMFTDAALHIALNSPAINSADENSVYDLPAHDLDGNVREQGGRVDRGAFETDVAQTDILVVNSTADLEFPPSGVMTLRRAIVQSNTIAGTQIIHFAVGSPAQCQAVFTLATPLPDITDSVRIDAEVHDDWVPNSSAGFNAHLCAKIRATTLGTVAHAFMVPQGSSASVHIRGIEFDKIVRPIVFNGGKNHVISGNKFGAATQHVTLSEVTGSRIGGIDLSQRNHFSRAMQRAVSVRAQDNKIIGNLFGPDSAFDPDATNRNEVGLEVTRTGNLVQYNRFNRSLDDALQLRGSNTTVRANEFVFNNRAIDVAQFFGLNGTGNDNEVSDNILLGNEEGIVLNPKTTGNRLSGNIGTATAGLGIDLDGNGAVNPNINSGMLPADAANKAQNYPVLLEAKTIFGEPHQAQVEGELSARNGTYDIEVFADTECHASGHGEGTESVGTRKVTVDGSPFSNGVAPFAVIVAGANPTTGLFLSATATDATGNTSEFGACLEVEAADGGPQPLPDAIFSDGFED